MADLNHHLAEVLWGDDEVIDTHLTLARMEQADRELHERRVAAAVGSHDRGEVTSGHTYADRLEGGDASGVGVAELFKGDGLAVLVALLPPLALGQPFLSWIYRALVLLVIGCPCALVISTPVTMVSELAAAARRGILIKGGVYLEQGRKLKAVAFDKTGTITKGEPAVTDLLPQPGQDVEQALMWVAGLAARSDHPLSRAIAAYTEQRSVSPAELTEFAALPGRGTKGWLNGDWLYLGSHRVIEDLNVCRPDLETVFEALERRGKTVVVLATEQGVVAVFGIADTVRETSRSAIADLHSLGVRTVMLSGDNQLTATAIAAQVGIDDARGSLLPEEKLVAIQDLIQRYGEVGMAATASTMLPRWLRQASGSPWG